MIKSLRLAVLVAALLFVGGVGDASAMGFGGYLSMVRGSGEWEIEDQSGFYLLKPEGDISRFGAGFVMDTAPARDTLFSYRLNAGFESFDADLDDINDAFELGGFAVDNTFGFQIYNSDAVRLWAGPHVVVGFYAGQYDELDVADVVLVEFGGGGAFGANFKTGPRLSISLVGGFTFSGYAGETELFISNEDVIGAGGSGFVNLSFIVGTGADARKK